MMSEKDNHSASPENNYDNDPLNDLVKLLNADDPFAEFVTGKGSQSGAGATRRMPQEVQMNVPVEPSTGYAPEAYAPSGADDAAYRGYDEAYAEPAFTEQDAAAAEPGFYAEPSFESPAAYEDDGYTSEGYSEEEYDDVVLAEPASPVCYAEELQAVEPGFGASGAASYEGPQEPAFADHENDYEPYAEPAFGAADLRGQQDDGTYAGEPESDGPEFYSDDALSRSLAAELEQSYLSSLSATAAPSTAALGDEGRLSIDEDFLGQYQAASYAAGDAGYDEPLDEAEFDEPVFDSTEEEPFDLTASLAQSLQASLQRNLDADQAAIEGIATPESDGDAEDGLFAETEDDGSAIPEWLGAAPAVAAAAGTAASVGRLDSSQHQPVRNEEQAATILELANQYEREASAREAAKRAQAAAAMAAQKPAKRHREKRRALPIYGGVAAVLVAVAGGAYAFLGGSVTEDGFAPPPIIKADSAAVKTLPEGTEVAEAAEPAGRKLIYDRVSGNETQTEERLVPRQEDVLQVQGASSAVAPVAPEQNLVANAPRRVQSVSIKPDGSIIRTPVAEPALPDNLRAPATPTQSGTDTGVRVITTSPAQSSGENTADEDTQTGPVTQEQPVALAQNAAATTPSAADLRPGTAAEAGEAEAAEPAVEAAEPKPADGDADTPAITLAAAPLPPARTVTDAAPRQAAAAPVALQTPVAAAGTPTVDARAALQQAQASTSQAAQPAAASNLASGGFVVQLSASRSEEEARTAFARYQTRYSALSGQTANIQRADLGNRGVYYRLGVGPLASRDAANNLCTQLRAQGLNDCFVRAN